MGDPTSLYDWACDLHDTGQSATQHNPLNHSCDLDGGTAHCGTYYSFNGHNRDGSNGLVGGVFGERE